MGRRELVRVPPQITITLSVAPRLWVVAGAASCDPLPGGTPYNLHMALYEYLCRDCQTSFEVRRPMGEVDSSVTCPSGHTDVRRKLSAFSSIGVRGTTVASAMGPGGLGPGGLGSDPPAGAAGGACGCGR